MANATIPAGSTSAQAQSIINGVNDGETCTLVQGTYTWATQVTINNAITFQGQNSVSAGRNQTIITGPNTYLTIQVKPNQNTHITGIQFQQTTTGKPIMQVTGNNMDAGVWDRAKGIRFSYCSWEGPRNFNMVFEPSGSVYGVMDHCYFGTGTTNENIQSKALTWEGSLYGDGSWADDESRTGGTGDIERTFVFEDNVFDSQQGSLDGLAGCRVVGRHNYLTNCHVATHGGVDSSGRPRGCYQADWYNNIIDSGTQGTKVAGVTSRGGSARMFNNMLVNWSNYLKFYSYRLYFNPPAPAGWFAADGTNAWDVNDRAQHTTTVGTFLGNGVTATVPSDTNKGAIYASGTYTGTPVGQSPVVTLQIPGSANANCWMSYSLINTSLTRGNGICNNTYIVKSTVRDGSGNVTLTCHDEQPNQATPFHLDNNQTWEIRRVIKNIDGIGTGKGNLWTGGSNAQVKVTPSEATFQALNPFEHWNNKEFTAGEGARSNVANWLTLWNQKQEATYIVPFPGLAQGELYPDGSNTRNAQNTQTEGPIGSCAQVITAAYPQTGWENAHVLKGPSSITNYNWDLNSTGTPANRVGADSNALAFGGYATNLNFSITGSGGAPYPHPLRPDAVVGGVPVITSGLAKSGVVNVAYTTGVGGTAYVITATNSPTSFSATSLPPGLSLSTDTIVGTPTTQGITDSTIGATNASGPGPTKTLRFTIAAAATKPSITLSTTTSSPIPTPATVALTATVTPGSAAVSYVEFYRSTGGATAVALTPTATSSPYTYSDGSLSANTYAYTAKAFDVNAIASDLSTPAITIVVTAGLTLTPPTIVVSG